MTSPPPSERFARPRFALDAASLSVPTARIALFVVYGWFGLLKILRCSPAGGLVHALHEATIPFLDFDTFYAAFGWFELAIAALCLYPRATNLALALLAFHIGATILPLFVLPHVAWQHFFVPTLEGQYIIKNLLIGAAAVTIAGGGPERSRRMRRRRPAPSSAACESTA